jgi:hypothetical protein
MMIALFAYQRLEQNGNGGANANNLKSWPVLGLLADLKQTHEVK